MNLPNELVSIIREKRMLQAYKGHFFHKIPQQLVALVSHQRPELSAFFEYSSDTVRWLIREENVPVLDWVHLNRNLWHNLPNDTIILAIVTHKQSILEWADAKLDPRFKQDILYAFKAVTAKNDQAIAFLRARGYKWSDDLLHLEENN